MCSGDGCWLCMVNGPHSRRSHGAAAEHCAEEIVIMMMILEASQKTQLELVRSVKY